VRGRAELDLERWLGKAGLRVEPPKRDPDADGGWLGVRTQELAGGRTQVQVVLAGGPAERAGLYAGDEIVALDGLRVDERSLRERLGARRAGERLRLHVFRREVLRELALELGERPPETLAIKPDTGASAEARSLCGAWIGEQAENKE
jgi:predicted metalloprotease with PDZ domain